MSSIKELDTLVRQQISNSDPDYCFFKSAISSVEEQYSGLTELTGNIEKAFDEWANCIKSENCARDEYYGHDGGDTEDCDDDGEYDNLREELETAEENTSSAAKELLMELKELCKEIV